MSAPWIKLGVLQKTLSRRKLLSRNWLKAKRKFAKEHEHVADFRRDLFFKLGILLTQDYDALISEDLDVEGLVQRGETGTRRRRLYDSTFSELRRCLEWLFLRRGRAVLAFPANNTSHECFQYGKINQNLTMEDRAFRC